MPSPPPARPFSDVEDVDGLTFFVALQEVAIGKRITRADWKNDEIVVFLSEGLLRIRNADGSLHALLVSDGDLQATDWLVVREN